MDAPAWWDEAGGGVTPEAATAPTLRAVTCATARHEVIEAMRWARGLLASGNVHAGEIAFAAAAPGEYDDLLLAISEEANLDVHFAHGRRALTTRDGQAAAALADILLHGLSQDRVRRLARLAHDADTPFGRLPEDWARALPRAAPLGTPERWRQATAALPAQMAELLPADARLQVLLPAIDLLHAGAAKAAEAGEVFLRGAARLLPVAARAGPRPGLGAGNEPGRAAPAGPGRRRDRRSAGCTPRPWPAARAPMSGCWASTPAPGRAAPPRTRCCPTTSFRPTGSTRCR